MHDAFGVERGAVSKALRVKYYEGVRPNGTEIREAAKKLRLKNSAGKLREVQEGDVQRARVRAASDLPRRLRGHP